MAGVVERRDGKLESFLHRHLPTEEYERLLARQPCVATVRGEGGGVTERPGHRHVAVGHRCLYLTEVPPKNIKTNLQLRDVDSIQIVSLQTT